MTDDFELRLPVGWTAAHDHAHYKFVNESDGEQLTLSVQTLRHSVGGEALVEAAMYVAEARRAAERAPPNVLSCSYPEIAGVFCGVDITFSVTDFAQFQRQVWVFGRLWRIVTVDFTRRRPLLGAGDYARRCSEIRASIHVNTLAEERRRPTRS